MVDTAATPDLYAVLQVDPTAEPEIIEAAYRLLMKKHHPDVAGIDAALAAQHHQRAKLINQAHSVLRDPVQRRKYDALWGRGGYAAPPPRSGPAQATRSRTSRVASDPTPAGREPAQVPRASTRAPHFKTSDRRRGPLGGLAAAYYLLPGPYEWEAERRQEALTACLLPPVGIAAFALGTGRLAPWLGHSPGVMLLAWAILIALAFPSWSSLPRLAMASLPSLLLVSGAANLVLRHLSIPGALAWVAVGSLSLVLSARLYVFAVLPTLAGCWVLTQLR